MNDPEADARASDDSNAHLERLRRVAFGRTSTDAEVAAAAAARQRLAELEVEAAEAEAAEAVRAASEEAAREEQRRAAEEREARARAEGRGVPGEAHPLDGDGAIDDESAAPARRRAWLLPAAAGLLVGAILGGGALWLTRPEPVEPPLAEPSQRPVDGGLNYFLGESAEAELPPGDAEAAALWFARVQSDDDLVGVPELRSEFDRNSVRLVHHSPAARVWIARQTDGSLCLETTETATQITNGSCVGAEQFERESLRVNSSVLTAAWTGSQLSVVLSLD